MSNALTTVIQQNPEHFEIVVIYLRSTMITPWLLNLSVNKGRNLLHLLWLSMFDGPLMLQVNWPVVESSIQS